MLDEVIDQIRALDLDHEFRALAEHVAVTSPVALDRLAYENLTTAGHEAQRIAAIQLRVVHEFANKLRWLEGVNHEFAQPSTRAAVMALLQTLCDSDTLGHTESTVAGLLEPAILFHALLSRLRPWFPPMIFAAEPDSVLDLLMLGIPDYMHALVHQRFSQLWGLFHRVRQLSAQQLCGLGAPELLGETQLLRTLDTLAPALRCPPAPPWTTPCWVTPWLAQCC